MAATGPVLDTQMDTFAWYIRTLRRKSQKPLVPGAGVEPAWAEARKGF